MLFLLVKVAGRHRGVPIPVIPACSVSVLYKIPQLPYRTNSMYWDR